MFEPFKFKGMQYLAIPDGNHVRVVSFIGEDFGLFTNIKNFKQRLAKDTFPVQFTKLTVETTNAR
jgi:hypothetical protein